MVEQKTFCGLGLEPLLEAGGPVRAYYDAFSSDVHQCSHCGYRGFHPQPPKALLDSYYSGLYWSEPEMAALALGYKDAGHTALGELKRIAETYREPLDKLRFHDVGCGIGTIVHHLRAEGVHATGSDLSEASIAKARELGNSWLEVGDLAEVLERAGEPIDFFFMSHSLEHIPNPVAELRTMAKALSPRGVIVIRVPNGLYAPAAMRRMASFHWFQFPNHLHFFTPKSFDCLLGAAGLRLVEVKTLPRDDQPALLMDTLLGRDHTSLRDYSRLLGALADNLLTCELQIVAVRADSDIVADAGVAAAVRSSTLAEQPVRQNGPVRARSAEAFALREQGEGGWTYGRAHHPPSRDHLLKRDSRDPYWIDHHHGNVVWPHKLRAGNGAATVISYRAAPRDTAVTWRIAVETIAPDVIGQSYVIEVFVDRRRIARIECITGKRQVDDWVVSWKGGGDVTFAFSRPVGSETFDICYFIDVAPLPTLDLD